MFCRRLAESRDEAEERGAVSLAAELEHLLASLEATVASVRKSAVDASRSTVREHATPPPARAGASAVKSGRARRRP
jgi:hypothetical protein